MHCVKFDFPSEPALEIKASDVPGYVPCRYASLSRECTAPRDPQADALKLESQRDLFTLIEAMTYVLKIPCTKEIPIPRICKWNSGSKDWVNGDNNQNMYSTSSQ